MAKRRQRKIGSYVPQIGETVFVSRKNTLGETVYFEGVVKRIRVEVECPEAKITTLASVATLETNVAQAMRGGNLF